MSSPLPVISVFVITYNHEPFIAAALEGIVNQQVECPMEVIIGEDCSTDGTYAICRAYAEKYPSLIRLLPSERNLKMMGNFLRTLHECKGEYIAFCEGDDYWTDPDKLRKQLSFLKANPSMVFAFHGSKTFDERTRTFGTYYRHPGFMTGVIDKATLFEKGGGAFVSPSIMFRRSLLTYPDWFLNAPTGDFPLLLLAVATGDIGYMEDEMCVVRQFTGVSWSESFKSLEAYQQYYEKESSLIEAFDQSTGHRFASWLQSFNQLRAYRLLIRYFHANRSWISRAGYFFKTLPKLNLGFAAKSFARIFIGVNKEHVQGL